jgi:hypothetical protein
MAPTHLPPKLVFLDLWTTTAEDRQPERKKLFGYAFTRSDVTMMIGEYAQETYCAQFHGQWHTYTQLRGLCLAAFLQDQGHARSWTLTDRNCQETADGFIVNFRLGSGIDLRD